MNFIIVHNVFLLLVIYCCNKASNRIVTRSKELVFYSRIPLSPEVSRLSQYTHAQQHTQTLRTFYTSALITLQDQQGSPSRCMPCPHIVLTQTFFQITSASSKDRVLLIFTLQHHFQCIVLGDLCSQRLKVPPH